MVMISGVSIWRIEEVAEQLGVSANTIRGDLRVLEIVPQKLGGTPMFDAELIERLKQYREKRERETALRTDNSRQRRKRLSALSHSA